MSAELYSASGSGRNDASLGVTTVGGSKPLHRFIKGQPKIVGISVLILGMSFFIISITTQVYFTMSAILRSLFVGSLFIICGILFILTEHRPTKKIVTVSLALSIVTILTGFWISLIMVTDVGHKHYYRHYDYSEDNETESNHTYWHSYEEIGLILETIFTFYHLVGVVIFIVMSCLAGAALRSTQNQAVIVMTTAPTETPVE